MEIQPINSFQFNFELSFEQKKEICWKMFKPTSDYCSQASEEDFVKELLPSIVFKYRNHKKEFLRFCSSLNNSLFRINYLNRWFSNYILLLNFFVTLSAFKSIKKTKFLTKFIKDSEDIVISVWSVTIDLNKQISEARCVDIITNNKDEHGSEEEGDQLQEV